MLLRTSFKIVTLMVYSYKAGPQYLIALQCLHRATQVDMVSQRIRSSVGYSTIHIFEAHKCIICPRWV